MAWNLRELLDIPNLQTLMERFYAATAIPVGIVAIDGDVLVATGWQEICTRFHRKHPVTAERCRQSSNYITEHLPSEGRVQYKCLNGLWDLAVPIVISGDRVATLFLGQFLYEGEEIDREFFRSQAQEFGFDEGVYLAALQKVPVFSREKVQRIMEFYSSFVDFLVNMGLANHLCSQTERALRMSEEKFAAAFNTAPISMVISTIDSGEYLDVNAEFEHQHQYTKDEVIGKTSAELDLWCDPRERLEIVEQLLQGREVRNREISMRDKHGDIHSGLYSGAIIELHGEKRLLGLRSDITARKRAEEALRESEAEKALILNSTTDLVIYHDYDMKILWGNKKAHESVGLQPGELTGRNCWEIWHHKSEPCLNCPVVLARDTGEPQESEIRSYDGRQWFIRGFPIRNDSGEVRGIVEFCLDITARKQMEEEIITLNRDLGSRASELEAAIRELETANRELEAFNYTVSHDLRTPLTGIKGYSHLLQELAETRFSAEELGYLDGIVASVQQMEQLIDTLLDFSRLSRCDMVREPVDLTAIARNVFAQLRLTGLDRKATFTVGEGLRPEGDPRLLGIVMENLIGNAWKYTGKQESAHIEVGAVETGGETAYFVRDNGEGFAMDDAGRLFHPFERLKQTKDFPGFGIGLATVQRIIQRHGGRVWATAEPHKGATFYFTL